MLHGPRRAAWLAMAIAAGCAPAPPLPARPEAPRPELATVHAVWMTDTAATGESLAVRMTGIVGPDGSWTLGRVRRDPLPGRPGGVLLWPEVARVPGDLFIQMEIPLDRVVWIPAGPAPVVEVCVAGRDTNLCRRARVYPGAHREPARVRATPGPAIAAGSDVNAAVDVEATLASGWVAALEWSEGGGPAERTADVQPDGARWRGRLWVHRPPADGPRTIAVKAIDGQGGSSAPAVVTLPARASSGR